MISEALRDEIESYARNVKRTNPLYLMALNGTLRRDNVGRYLVNVLHLLRHTPLFLERARARAIERGEESLAKYFEQKLAEEQGHDDWAVADIRNFNDSLGVRCQEGIMPSLASLLTYLQRTIDEDPVLYLAYILFAEYFTVLEAPQWLALLEERCGVPRDFMSAIGNHAELDKEHVHEGLDAIDCLVTDPSYVAAMRDSLRHSIHYFDSFLTEVAEQRN